MNWLFRFLNTEPALDAIEDMTGRGLGMDYWLSALGVNDEFPRVGDVVAKLDSCGMGVSVRRDTRFRVTETKTPYATSFIGTDRDGNRKVLHTHNLRRHTGIRRFWILQS